MRLHYFLEDPFLEQRGRKRENPDSCFYPGSKRQLVCGLIIGQDTTLGPCLWSEVCGLVCTETMWLSSYRVEIKLKIKAFWQSCQPPAYFPGDVTTDVGLYPWASAFGSVPPPPMEMHVLWENTVSIFKPRRDKTCWVSYRDWFNLPWFKVCKNPIIDSHSSSGKQDEDKIFTVG